MIRSRVSRIRGWLAGPAMFGIVLLMSGCATGTMTVAGEESQPEPLKLPELVEAERINEDPIVASPEPTITESDPLPGAMVEEPPSELEAAELDRPAENGHEPVVTPVEMPSSALLEELEATPVYLLDVPFNFDQYRLRDDALAFMEVNATRMKEEGVNSVLLEGRGDEVGTTEYNLVLGERRALAVKRYLMDLGLTPSTLHTTSYGKERPLCTDHNVECWQMNRSVHFVVK